LTIPRAGFEESRADDEVDVRGLQMLDETNDLAGAMLARRRPLAPPRRNRSSRRTGIRSASRRRCRGLNGRLTTVAPVGTSRAVVSVEPSSMTRTSKPGSARCRRRTSSPTDAPSLNAGTIARHRGGGWIGVSDIGESMEKHTASDNEVEPAQT
jgi:hypothetical protein